MKVIDLFNKIAKGEAPEKIKYQNYKWVWTGDDYKTIKGVKECFLITGQEYTFVTEFLNDEVEIIEEEKEIEELNLEIKDKLFVRLENKDTLEISSFINAFNNKINELVRELNEIKKERK